MGWLLYTMAAPPALAVLLRLLSAVLPRGPARLASFAAFCVTSVVCMAVCASYGVVASIVLRLVGYGGLSQWTVARSFKWTMWWTTGVTFRVLESSRVEGGRRGGPEALETRPAVFVGNHQTELDVLMLGCVFPKYISVTAKKSLKYYPFLGWFMALSKTVFIDRANRATARAAFDGAAKTMREERQSVFIFPEGTRSYTEKPELLPFKKGAFHLAVQAQVPIVPVVVANYSHVLDVKKRIFNPGVVDVSVLPPIPTKGLTTADVDVLTVKTRDAMLDELIRLSHVSGTGNAVPLPRASKATAVENGVDGVEGLKQRY
ncbi:1-acylglycerol-3-phosphate O-acyltransferase [Westerdykella ornata]|uniref:1-acyl-sn-glycerol-3-phosphate acyltransferase n=1 Tax=Westerdykella ornata TaxID=318751 RepID=A0A6A6JVH7_WESOR|nr:1-acylglycerol-3-phosphate O-acyltransferase [Westerdykella ornata]KAF2279818.1 1-acylglycerol-3-phosphate O-acyltransferase [Westerdykella ornata]